MTTTTKMTANGLSSCPYDEQTTATSSRNRRDIPASRCAETMQQGSEVLHGKVALTSATLEDDETTIERELSSECHDTACLACGDKDTCGVAVEAKQQAMGLVTNMAELEVKYDSGADCDNKDEFTSMDTTNNTATTMLSTNDDMRNDYDHDDTSRLENALELIFLGAGAGSIAWHVVSFLDPSCMGNLRLVNIALSQALDTTRCMLRWLEQRPASLNATTGNASIAVHVLANDYDYWDCRGLIRKALQSGVDPNYRYPNTLLSLENDENKIKNLNDDEEQMAAARGLSYHYNAQRAERLLLQNANTIEGTLSSNDFILDQEGHIKNRKPYAEAVPFSLRLSPGWVTNVFYQPRVSRDKGLARACTIVERFEYCTSAIANATTPAKDRWLLDDESAFNRELVLKTVRRLTKVKPGMGESLFQHASYSSEWRINQGEFKGSVAKRQQTLVLQFQTSHGQHPVELVLHIEKKNV